jgi:hemolysin activation/secretion protein
VSVAIVDCRRTQSALACGLLLWLVMLIGPVQASSASVPFAANELVANWARSWERQDFHRYATFYSDEFSSAGFKSRRQWLDYRRPRILGPEQLQVRIDDLKVLESREDRIVVEFIQFYQAEKIRMHSLTKQVWTWDEAVWKIQQESTIDLGPERPLITGDVVRPLSMGERPIGAIDPRTGLPIQAEPPADQNLSLRLETPERAAIPRAIDRLRFAPVRVEVEGVSAFPVSEVVAFTEPLHGKEIGLEELRQAAERIENKYKEAGFFLTRVFVPPQHVRDGVFRIKVIEGHIADIEVEGNDPAVRERVRGRLEALTLMRPARLDEVERALLMLNDQPALEVSSILRPGREVGETTLVAQVEQTSTSPGSISVSNQVASGSGDQVFRLGQQFIGVGQEAGVLEVQLGASDQPERFANTSIRYTAPIGEDGMTLGVGHIESRSKPEGQTDAQVISESSSTTARLRMPLRRARGFSLYGELGLSAVRSDTSVLGTSLYRDRYDSVDLSLQVPDWATAFGRTSGSITYSQAMSDESTSPSVDDFSKNQRRLSAGLRQVIPLSQTLSLSLSAQGQYAGRPLLSGERIGFGGGGIGRGFEPGVISGDRGIGISAELGLVQGYSLTEGLQARAQFFAFADAARTERLSASGAVTSKNSIQSAGLGVRFQVTNGLKAEILWAKPVKHDRTVRSISDGVFFTLTYSW